MFIQTGGKTDRRLAFYHTLFTSKFSCTGGVGHFPRWKACPDAALKRLASAESSSSAVTILGLWREPGVRRNKAACVDLGFQGHAVTQGGGGISGDRSGDLPLNPLTIALQATWVIIFMALGGIPPPGASPDTLYPLGKHILPGVGAPWIYFPTAPSQLCIFQGQAPPGPGSVRHSPDLLMKRNDVGWG